MERYVRAVGSAVASGGGGDVASGGGGGQSSSSRAAEPGDEPCVDLEVSSNSSGEDLGAATLPEGVDVKWAQQPESGPLARWCGARAFSVCRRVVRVLAASNIAKEKEGQESAGKLHLSLRQVGSGKRRWMPTEKVQAAVPE